LPRLEAIYNDYHSLGYEGISVNLAEDMNTVKFYARQYSYLFLLDSDLSTWNTYKQNDLRPLNYVIDNDANMTVAFWMEGFDEPTIRAWIEWCLEGVQETPDAGCQIPDARLLQNSPNPCRESTIINFQLPMPGHSTLNVYDASGRLVATLIDGKLSPGAHKVRWEKGNNPSGIYFYRLSATRQGGSASGGTTATFTSTKKMVVVE